MRSTARAIKLVAIAAFVAAACGLPFGGSPTPFASPTPNLTMTALFSPIELPTLTPVPVITATLTPTPEPPTESPTTAPPPETAAPTAVQPSATSSTERPGAKVEAEFLNTAPNIEGVWDEWTTSAFPARTVVFGPGNWTGPDDLELSYRIGWDDDNLYIAVKVKDETYVQNATGDQIFKGDFVEVLLDVQLQGDFSDASLSSDDYQLGLSAGSNLNSDGDDETYLWFPASVQGPRPQVNFAAVEGSGVYRLEAAIPWSLFGIDPQTGQVYGFGISVSDNDRPGENVQQTMVSSAQGRSLGNPTTWGTLELAP